MSHSWSTVRSFQQPNDFFLQRAPRLHQFTSILNHFSHPSRTAFRLHKEEVRLGHPTSFGKQTIFFFFSWVGCPSLGACWAYPRAGSALLSSLCSFLFPLISTTYQHHYCNIGYSLFYYLYT